MKQPDCPKCQRKMDVGHVPDMGYGAVYLASWAAGTPVERKYVGGIKVDKKQQIPLAAYRCPRCGLVELYAFSENG